jgi:UDP-N-acetylmuramyl pentapeptide phosphotransferase/UDP-N-acetylglucosamine-1-phosphate transferase
VKRRPPRSRDAPGPLATGALSGLVTLATAGVLTRRTAPDSPWTRRNFRDREVTLLLGPAVATGAIAGIAASGGRGRRGALLVTTTAAVVGAYDDRYGDRHARGLAGHARALRAGRLTTGMVKLVSIVAAAAAASAGHHRRVGDAALGTVLVAGGANLVNLFDLRPGRAAKVSLLAAALLAAGPAGEASNVAAAAAGAALAALPADLGERAMLGDCGAGTLGAALGWSAAVGRSRPRRAVTAAGIVALTLASEKVSFSAVIDKFPPLRAVDGWGRRPA